MSYTPAGTTTTTTTTTTYNQLQTDTDYLTYLYDYTSAGTTVSTQTLVTTGTSEETSSTGGTASTVYVTTDSNIYYNNTQCTSLVSSTCGVYELNYNNDKIDIHINPSNTKLVIVGQKTTGNVMESQVIGTTTGNSNLIVIIQY